MYAHFAQHHGSHGCTSSFSGVSLDLDDFSNHSVNCAYISFKTSMFIVLAGFIEPRGQVQDFKPRGFLIIWPNRVVFIFSPISFLFGIFCLTVSPWSSASI
jgi:hypothetical protein